MPQQTLCEVIRVLLADDHAILRDGLKAILREEGFDVVAEASDGLASIRLCEEWKPEIAVLDLSMPVLNGIDAGREILKVSPNTKVVLLSMHTEDRYVLASLRAGISAYVVKSKAASNLVHAIHEVLRGGIFLCPSISKAVVGAYLAKDDTPADPLSIREREVLHSIAEGKNVKEIGGILGISTKTAESHRANIMRKLQIHHVAGLVRYAIRNGVVTAG